MISHDITYQHLCQYNRSTVQRFNGSTPNLVEHSTETSPCRARRSWLCLRERPGDPGGRSLHRQPHVAQGRSLDHWVWSPCHALRDLAVAPKKWRKKTENFNATQFSATFQRTFEHTVHTSSSFTLNEVLPFFRWHGAAIYPGWRPSELPTGSTGENGWRVIPANYPLVIYWLVVWNGLKHGFYDFPFMLGME